VSPSPAQDLATGRGCKLLIGDMAAVAGVLSPINAAALLEGLGFGGIHVHPSLRGRLDRMITITGSYRAPGRSRSVASGSVVRRPDRSATFSAGASDDRKPRAEPTAPPCGRLCLVVCPIRPIHNGDRVVSPDITSAPGTQRGDLAVSRRRHLLRPLLQRLRATEIVWSRHRTRGVRGPRDHPMMERAFARRPGQHRRAAESC
jgi:hypothetical protein